MGKDSSTIASISEYARKLASLRRSSEPGVRILWRIGSHTSPGVSWKVRTVLWPTKMLTCSVCRMFSRSSSSRTMMKRRAWKPPSSS